MDFVHFWLPMEIKFRKCHGKFEGFILFHFSSLLLGPHERCRLHLHGGFQSDDALAVLLGRNEVVQCGQKEQRNLLLGCEESWQAARQTRQAHGSQSQGQFWYWQVGNDFKRLLFKDWKFIFVWLLPVWKVARLHFRKSRFFLERRKLWHYQKVPSFEEPTCLEEKKWIYISVVVDSCFRAHQMVKSLPSIWMTTRR